MMMSLMPCTACRSRSSAILKASKKLVPLGTSSQQAVVGHRDDGVDRGGELAPCLPRPSFMRRAPSNPNGLVTTATVRASSSLASDGNHRRRARARAAAQPGGDEDHIRALEHLDDLRRCFRAPPGVRCRDSSRRRGRWSSWRRVAACSAPGRPPAPACPCSWHRTRRRPCLPATMRATAFAAAAAHANDFDARARDALLLRFRISDRPYPVSAIEAPLLQSSSRQLSSRSKISQRSRRALLL